MVEQPPVELARLGPLRLLPDLDPHEDQLLAGVGPHEGEIGPQVGQLLPPVAGHLAQQGALAVDDLVVAEREHEVLGEGVGQAEGQVVVVPGPVDRLVREVVEGVVHPAHVPLEPEAEPVGRGRLSDARPGRRLLGDRGRAGDALVDGGVHLLEELHGLEVLAAAVDVRRPLALGARVVEVEHRGDAVDAEAVGMELLEPVEGVRVEVVAHLATAEVEDVGAPLLVPAALRVGVLVERRPVEPGQRPLVGGEVPGHPVQEYADAVLVEGVDEPAEAVGVAEARVRSEVRRHVVAPRARRTGAASPASARRG